MANTGTMTLSTARLLLRKFRISDYSYFKTWFVTPEAARYSQGDYADRKKECFSFFLRRFVNYYIRRKNKNYYWAVVLDGKMIGFVGFNDNRNDIYSIHYALAPEYWHQGYTGEAVAAVTEYMRTQDYQKIFGACDRNNIASFRLLESNGFTRVKTIPNAFHYPDGSTGDKIVFRFQ